MWPTDWLVRRLIPRWEQTSDPAVRMHYGALEAWVSIVSNTLMAVAKFALGVWVNSIAILADAGHTLADSLTSVVVLIGFRAAGKPSDPEHPHGHGRMESVSTLIIATLLAAVGVDFLVQSIKRVASPEAIEANWLVAGAMLAFGAAKEAMARFSSGLGRRIEASALEADAWHHRTDAIASALVAVGMVGVTLGYRRLDGAFGIAVSLLILYTGIELIRSSASMLVGEAPDAALVRKVVEAARSVLGVAAVHEIEVHDYGQHKDVSLHIEVSSRDTVTEAHEVATAVEEAVSRRLGVSAVVHVDPLERVPVAAPAREVRAAIEAVIRDVPEAEGFHAVTVARPQAGQGIVHFHVVVSPRMDLGRAHELSHELTERISARLPGFQVTIHVEPGKPQPGGET